MGKKEKHCLIWLSQSIKLWLPPNLGKTHSLANWLMELNKKWSSGKQMTTVNTARQLCREDVLSWASVQDQKDNKNLSFKLCHFLDLGAQYEETIIEQLHHQEVLKLGRCLPAKWPTTMLIQYLSLIFRFLSIYLLLISKAPKFG